MIAIIDYGMGNLHSVENALHYIGAACKITRDAEEIKAADGVILPGVGAFPDCMENLHQLGLVDVIKAYAMSGKPLLGICLGMQVLFEKGYEGKVCEGLGLLVGEVKYMEETRVKIPQIGWNELEVNVLDEILHKVKKPFVYYVHSYYVCNYDERDLMAYSTYGSLKVPGYVRHQNILGMQYHPEKSGEDGLAMLREFKEMCVC